MTEDRADMGFMARGLDLARGQLGRTAPNPSVGCVVVRAGRIIAEGATGAGGRPHAEEIALEAAGQAANGAIAYVTLEPCNVRSSGAASCADLLIAASITRVVIACEDPHRLGAGGLAQLRAAGIDVAIGLMRKEAETLNAGFFKLVATGRPWLAIDGDRLSYDAEFELAGKETYEQALDRFGNAGLTRVFVQPRTPLAAQLKARGLIDGDNTK